MPKSFEEIDRAKAVEAVSGRSIGPSREEILAEQDRRNEEARGAILALHEEAFGSEDVTASVMPGSAQVAMNTGGATSKTSASAPTTRRK